MEPSPFLQLPGELRNRIYELALFHAHGISIRVLTGTPQLLEPPQQHLLALSRTCRRIRRECSAVLYGMNRFTLIAKPSGQRSTEQFWQRGLRNWLVGIGESNRRALGEVEIDIGTSFMYDLCPSSETIWRGVSSLLGLFDRAATRVYMKTDVNWMSRSRRTFAVAIPLNDIASAHATVRQALRLQRAELDMWCRTAQVVGREVGYRRMELETCGQELRSFLELLETANASRLD